MMMGLGNELTTPITPGDEMKTYVITKARPLPASQIRHVFIRPSDVPGATFAIESVRLDLPPRAPRQHSVGRWLAGMREVVPGDRSLPAPQSRCGLR